MQLIPDQESIVRGAVARRLASSAEEFVLKALRNQQENAAYEPELEGWLRNEVIPAHDEFVKDPSSSIPASKLPEPIKAHRAAEAD